MRFVCQQFFIVSLFCPYSVPVSHFVQNKILSQCILSVFVVQEIKFEPCVMCEHLDKRTSFRLSQVYRVLNVL
jgi:hypothetical protein